MFWDSEITPTQKYTFYMAYIGWFFVGFYGDFCVDLSPFYRQSVVIKHYKIRKKWFGTRHPSHLKALFMFPGKIIFALIA